MNYYNPPPWWGMPPPPQNQNHRPLNRRELDKIAKNAVRDAMRLRDKDKMDKRKRREERGKKAAQTRQKLFTFIEIFILGLVLHPFVGAAYNHLIAKFAQ